MSSLSSPASGGEAAAPERRYKGVRWRKWGKWVSEIRLPNCRERIWLGSYDAPEKAARAFDAAFVCLRGAGAAEAGGLNFPESPPAVPRTSDPQEVFAAAAAHANRRPAAADPGAGADEESHGSAAVHYGGGAPMEITAGVLTSLQVPSPPAEGFDWSPQLIANPPPLYSPTTTVMGGHVYSPLSQTAAEDDIEENDSGLWSFDFNDKYTYFRS